MSETAVDALTEAEAKAELARLVTEIKLADSAYYKDDDPHLTDAEYDALRQRNLDIEKRFPHLKRKDSPSDRVVKASVTLSTGTVTSVMTVAVPELPL